MAPLFKRNLSSQLLLQITKLNQGHLGRIHVVLSKVHPHVHATGRCSCVSSRSTMYCIVVFAFEIVPVSTHMVIRGTLQFSFWLRHICLCHSIMRGSHLLPDQLPEEHTELPPFFQLAFFMNHHLFHTHMHTGRSMVDGHIPMVHTVLLCAPVTQTAF